MSRRPARRHRHTHRGPKPLSLFKRFVSFLVFIVVLCVAALGVFWWMGDALFPLKNNQNIVFVPASIDDTSKQIYVSHFSPTNHSITVVPVGGELMVDVMGGYGEYQLSKVYQLLTIDDRDEHYMRAAYSLATGVVIDDVVPVGDEITELNTNVLLDILKNQRLVRLYFFARSVPSENVVVSETMSDTSKLGETTAIAAYQDCSIALVNTTKVPRLATRISAVLENSGFLVVRLDDMATISSSSVITYDRQKTNCAAVAQRVQSVFPSKLEEVDQPELRQEHRADLVVVIGEDVGNLFIR